MSDRHHVTFVIDARHISVGSTRMRSVQLAKIVKAEFGEAFTYSISEIPRNRYRRLIWAALQPRDAVLFFTKTTLSLVSQKILDVLAYKGVQTCLDYVDADLTRCRDLTPSVHVAASLKAQTEMLTLLTPDQVRRAPVVLVHHAPDEKVLGFGPVRDDVMAPVYLGFARNAFWSARISDAVTMLSASTAAEMEDSMTRLAEFNFHYCVRNHQTDAGKHMAKPFTKGFIAAYCASPVIVDRSEYDAVALLGEDYPYLVDGNDEQEILNCLTYARATFKQAEWDLALSRVQGLKSVCAPTAVARQFIDMVEGLGG